MLPAQPVLVGTQVVDLGFRIATWVEGLGYEVQVSSDGVAVVEALRRGSYAASFLDDQLGGAGGESIWRMVRPVLGRRLILMARALSNELWFEALRSGVGSVLPLPPEPSMVRAAMQCVAVRAPRPSGSAGASAPPTPLAS